MGLGAEVSRRQVCLQGMVSSPFLSSFFLQRLPPLRKRSALPPPLPPSGPRHEIQTLRRLLPYLWPAGEAGLRLRVVAALGCLAGAKACAAVVPLLYKHVIDLLSPGVVPEPSWGLWASVPLVVLLAYGSSRLMQQVFNELQDLVFAKVTERAVRAVGLRAFRHLHRLSLRFHLDRQTGGLSRVIERGTRGIELMLRLVVFRSLPTVLELVIVCSILWTLLDWRFAAITAGTIGAYGVFTMVVTQWRAKFRRAMNLSDAEAGAKAVDSLLNFETVKFFNTEEHEAQRYETALAAYERAALRSKTSLAGLNLGQGLIIAVGLVAIMALAAQGVQAGTVSVGAFVMVNSYLLQMTLPLNFLGMLYRELKQALIDMETLFALLDQKPDVSDRPQAAALALRAPPRVVFDRVSFGYDAARPVLDQVSFTIEPGQKLAVVGASGAGKSTLARLLFRFWDVTGGAITIDGIDLRDVGQDSLRAAIGVVPQDCVLFNDSLGYNIAYGRPGASGAEVAIAAQQAHLGGFIASLPEGLETRVGERGLTFQWSGRARAYPKWPGTARRRRWPVPAKPE